MDVTLATMLKKTEPGDRKVSAAVLFKVTGGKVNLSMAVVGICSAGKLTPITEVVGGGGP